MAKFNPETILLLVGVPIIIGFIIYIIVKSYSKFAEASTNRPVPTTRPVNTRPVNTRPVNTRPVNTRQVNNPNRRNTGTVSQDLAGAIDAARTRSAIFN